MPPTVTLESNALIERHPSATSREADRQLLASITRQHEAAVFSYLFRRVRRSVDVNQLTQEVFARMVRENGLTLERDALRSRLLRLAEIVLEDFTAAADPHDAAWTVLCLELDQLARSRQADKPA